MSGIVFSSDHVVLLFLMVILLPVSLLFFLLLCLKNTMKVPSPRPSFPQRGPLGMAAPSTRSPSRDSLYLSSPKPYLPPGTPQPAEPLTTPAHLCTPGSRISPRGVPCPGPRFQVPHSLALGPNPSKQPLRTVEQRECGSSNPHHEAVGNKKVSSLYVPCLSLRNAWPGGIENLSGVARDPAKGTEASTGHRPPTIVSRIAAQGRHPAAPPNPPKLSFDIQKMPLAGQSPSPGAWPSSPDAVRAPGLGPQVTSLIPKNWKRTLPFAVAASS